MKRKRWMSPGHTGRRLDLSVARLAQLDQQGKLPAMRDSSGRRFWDPDVVERFAHEREARRAGKPTPAAPEFR